MVGGNLVGAGASFAAAIVAARVLSLDQFAAFGVGLAVNSLAVQFADFGLGTVAVAETADSASRIDARAKLRTLALHRARTAIVVGALIAIVVSLLPSLSPYRVPAVVGAAGEVFGCLTLFFVWSLQGEHSFALAGAIQSLQGILRLALVGACAVAGLESTAMMVGYAVIAPAVSALIGGLVLFARPPAPESPDAAPISETTGIDLERRRVIAFTGVFAAMVINGDVLLLTVLAGSHEVAAYTAAWRFSSGMLLINTAIASALLPFIVSASSAWTEAKQLVRLGLLVSAGWFVLVPVLAVIGPILLGSVGDDAKGPLIVLLIAFALDGFYFVLYQIFLRVRRERLLLVAMVCEFVTMVVVTILLRSHGALAPAYGQLAARVVVCTIGITPIALAALGRSTWFSQDEYPNEPVAPEPPPLIT